VDPLAPGGPGLGDRSGDDRRRDPLPLAVAAGLGVEQEGVVAAVPGDVDEPDDSADEGYEDDGGDDDGDDGGDDGGDEPDVISGR